MYVDSYLPAPTGNSYEGNMLSTMGGERHFDPGMRRPYLDKYDRPCVTINTGRWTVEKGQRVPIRERKMLRDLILQGVVPPIFNATALRKEEWIMLDTAVLRAARFRLRAYNDIAAANSFGGFNGMAKMILEHETMSDPGEAVVDMDGLSDGRTDAPKFQLEGLPLPITHSDYWFGNRVLSISRNSGTPLDSTMAESCSRRVAEMIEKTTIGVNTGITYGGNSTHVGGYGRTSSVYGLTNFTSRLTKTNMTTPLGTNPEATVADVLAMRQSLYNNKFYGPFMLYHSNDWDTFLDNDYARAVTGAVSVATSKTLRERLRSIEGITDVRRLDFLFAAQLAATTGPGTDVDATLKPFRMILVQMTPDVVRAVNGMDITTVQWESQGGMRVNFKVMTIQVPQLRADFYGNAGILDGATS